ncbi:MAG: paraquat-inducible protein A [Crocinitomicaceae bacterium]|nr:paraquat-inducible protein A [Crocinitomicaceae bacterium]
MKKYTLLLVATLIVFATTVVLTFAITSKLNNYKVKKEEIVLLLDAEARLGNLWEWVPFFGPGDEIMENKRELEDKADLYYNSAVKNGVILFSIVVAYLILISLVYGKKEYRNQAIGLSFVMAAMCFLYLGLQSPFLEIQAFKDDVTATLPITDEFEFTGTVEGRVYFLYQNKSVLELIKLLYMGGNYFVAIIILIFSIVFPTVKLLTSSMVFFAPGSRYSKQAVTVIDKLGKWSMADVFVSSVFLAYFSFANMNVGVDTGASTLIGLYFFVAFVVFSIGSGRFLKNTVIEASKRRSEADSIPA